MDNFFGSYELDKKKDENFDEYLSAKGVPYLIRKMVKLGSVTKTFQMGDETENSYILMTKRTTHTDSWTFQLDVPFDAQGMDKKIHKITFSIKDGCVLTEKHEIPGVRVDTVDYSIDGDFLVMTMEAKEKGIVSRRWLKKVS